MLHVTISEVTANGRTWTHETQSGDEWDAVQDAVVHNFGRKHFFQRDGFRPGFYGVMYERLPGGGFQATSGTARVCITVEPVTAE